MTTTTLINAQSIGTGSNIGNRLFGAKLTAATTTTAYLISARLTDGAGPTDPGQVRIWHTSASFNISAANGPAQLNQTARYLDLNLTEPTGGQIIVRDGTLEPLTGQYIHVWVDAPRLTTAATLDVNVVEVP